MGLTLSTGLSAITMHQAFEKALEHRSGVLNKKIDENVALLRKSQTLSEFYPKFELSSVNQWRDQSTSSEFERQFSTARQHTARLTMRQMLFHGGAEYEALKIAGLEIEARRLEQEQLALEIYETVAHSFFSILSLQTDLQNLKSQVQALERRNTLLKQRVALGRNKSSDLTASLSQMARLRAEIPSLEGRLEAEQQNFLWLVGLEHVDTFEAAEKELDVPDHLIFDTDKIPAIKAKRKLSEIQEKQVNIARTEYLPNIDLSTNYYLDRTGTPSDARWDAALTATWNLFSGNSTKSEVRVRILERIKLENEIADLSRQRQRIFEAQKAQLRHYQTAVKDLQSALDFARKAYEEQQKDFELGLVSNLEVLRSLDDVLQAKRNFDLEKMNGRLLWVRLHTTAGIIP